MRNDEYISLYDYKGTTSRESGLGLKVYNAAKEKQVQVVYKDIPEDRQRPEYNRVATYPKWFLDEYLYTNYHTIRHLQTNIYEYNL